MANETITGKIFQLKDPSNSYNRFPRTVMEAVYGLNTYLQNQFSALADIYMPIEGITESKPLQEFVYRACPSSIKAKSVSLDRIYGKTLAWNQVFNDHLGYANVIINDGTYEIADSGIDTYIVMPAMAGHKYLYSIYADVPSGAIASFGFPSQTENEKQVVSGINNWIGIAPEDNRVVFDDVTNPSGAGIKFNRNQLIDLTLLYGSEIDGMTDAQILAKFEAEYPGYHDYCEGKLISNDAESIETVGFNQWDEEWEQGYFQVDGTPTSSAANWRTKNYIPVFPGSTYYVKANTDIRFVCYDSNLNWLGYGTDHVNQDITFPSNCYYVKFFRGESSYTVGEINFNLSDPAKNGTYEPYRKSTMQLGLDNIKVKSHNIWDEELLFGYSIDDNTGNVYQSSNYIISKNPILVSGGKTYNIYIKPFDGVAGYGSPIFQYDVNMNYLGYISTSGAAPKFTVNDNCRYIKIRLLVSEYGPTYNHDICINESSSFNGQYEPHGVIIITDGLKSAGSVKDEIVGNKYIQRVKQIKLGNAGWSIVSSDSAIGGYLFKLDLPSDCKKGWMTDFVHSKYIAFNGLRNTGSPYSSINATPSFFVNDTAYENSTAGLNSFVSAIEDTYLNYAIATPIEYELVSPLVTTVKAGTTEARISPNSDSLSAPMVADMTYSAGQSEDATQAQYATVAGRLYNSHKLWGQDFDGTQDVSGALTGVTNLNSLLYFGSNNIGIGQSNPQYKLDVSGTARVTGNTTIGGTLGVTGATTLTGALTANGAVSINNTLTVGTAQTNRATTLNGALTVTGLATIAGGLKLTTTKKIWFGDSYWVELHNDGYLLTNAPIVSQSYITAGAVNPNA